MDCFARTDRHPAPMLLPGLVRLETSACMTEMLTRASHAETGKLINICGQEAFISEPAHNAMIR